LRAVSVGFQPIEREALADNSGILFTKQELLETSLVSVPANPSAVQLARSLKISDDTIDRLWQARREGQVRKSRLNRRARQKFSDAKEWNHEDHQQTNRGAAGASRRTTG
jgi:hypothetical protein